MGNRIELLSNIDIFRGIEEPLLARLGECLRPLSCEKGKVIVNQEADGEAMYIIAKGRVKVVLYGESGREMILSFLSAGQVFGEMSLLDKQPRSATVIASEAAELFALNRDDFIRHLFESPKIALNILAEMCRRLRHADSLIGNLGLLEVSGRLAHVLITMAKERGTSTDEGILLEQRHTQQDLASMIGTSRETVSRVLSEFQRRGLIAMQGKDILLGHSFDEVFEPSI